MPSTQEEFVRTVAELSNVMLDAMRNKDVVLRELFGLIQRQKKVENGLEQFLAALADGKDRPDQLAQMLSTTIKVVQEHSKAIRRLSAIALVYLAGGNFTTDAAHVANKLGAGEEALREMFRQKMGGKA